MALALSRIVMLSVLFAAIAVGADAQQLEPRTYANTPVGMNFLIAGYGCAPGSIILDPSIPLQNVDIQNHELVLAWQYRWGGGLSE